MPKINWSLSTRSPLLTTWNLWHHLLHPVAHPMFRRTLMMPPVSSTANYLTWIAPLIGSLLCCLNWTMLIQLTSSFAVLVLVAMIAFSSFYVAPWVISIPIAIIKEHEHGTYDQLCLTPAGALGANWAICTATLHRHDALNWMDWLRKLIAGLILIILVITLMTTAIRENNSDTFQLLGLLLDILTLVIISYADHVQSAVLGSLIGMIVPLYTHSNLDARFLSIMTFLMLQVTVFVVTIGIVSVLLPGLPNLITLTLIIFYLTREGCIIVLWRILSHRWNVSFLEFAF